MRIHVRGATRSEHSLDSVVASMPPARLSFAALICALLIVPAAAQAQSPTARARVFAPTDAPLGDALQDQPSRSG